MNYYHDYYTEIVYYEYERPSILMNSNGSIVAKPNKWEIYVNNIYYCSNCGKAH